MKMIKLQCKGCRIIFEKQLKEYKRQIKNKNENFYCTLKCGHKYITHFNPKHQIIDRQCLYCNEIFKSTTHKRYQKCCSSDCSHKYSQTFVDKDKISKSLKLYYKNNPPQTIIINENDSNNIVRSNKIRYKVIKNKHCEICNNVFQLDKNFNIKTCGIICSKKLMSNNSTANPNCGGQTNYKKFQYKGIWMDSSWEVNIAKWMDEHNIQWKRDKKINFTWTDIEGRKRRYYPDFYLEQYNIYLDPKNKYLIEKDTFKINQVQKENNIKVIFGLQENIIEYLKQLIPASYKSIISGFDPQEIGALPIAGTI
jgi:hypothetical protein